MELLFLCIAAAIICIIGIALFRLAARKTEMGPPLKLWCFITVFQFLLLFLLRLYYQEQSLVILKYLTLCIILWVCAWTDYKKYLILNGILLWALFMRGFWLIAELLLYGWNDVRFILISAGIASVMLGAASLLCKLVSPRAVGFGDVKLLIILGIYTGIDLAVEILIYTFAVMFIIAVALLALKKANRKTVLPFAPFLLAGTILTFLLIGI